MSRCSPFRGDATGRPTRGARGFVQPVFTTDHGFSQLGDVVMRRDEAVNDVHLQVVVCGSRDLAGVSGAIARAWRRTAGRESRVETAPLNGHFDDQFNRTPSDQRPMEVGP